MRIRKSTSEEFSSSKRARVELSQLERKANLKNQKVMWGRVFDPEITNKPGMKDLVEIMEFQKWSHLFVPQSLKVYEDEVRSFYVGLIVVDEATLCSKVNGKDFVLGGDILGEILEVPTDGLEQWREILPLLLKS